METEVRIVDRFIQWSGFTVAIQAKLEQVVPAAHEELQPDTVDHGLQNSRARRPIVPEEIWRGRQRRPLHIPAI